LPHLLFISKEKYRQFYLTLDEIPNNHTRNPPLISPDSEREAAIDELLLALLFFFLLNRRRCRCRRRLGFRWCSRT
jgi:hypothetical protein